MAKLTKKILHKFPEVVFVAKKSDGDSEWFDCHEEAAECMDDDGPAVVAHYTLGGVYKLQKTVRTIDNVMNRKRR
jgi:hypothetical protein